MRESALPDSAIALTWRSTMSDISPQPIPYFSGAPAMPFAGIRTGSRVLGVISIVLGTLSGCTVLALPLACWRLTRIPIRQCAQDQMIASSFGQWLPMRDGADLVRPRSISDFGDGRATGRQGERSGCSPGITWAVIGIGLLPFPRCTLQCVAGPAATSFPGALEWVIIGFSIVLYWRLGPLSPEYISGSNKSLAWQ